MTNPRRMQQAAAGVSTGESGTLYSWGSNSNGSLGQGDTDIRSRPTQVGSLENWVNIGAGENVTFAINSDGKMYSTGEGTYTGQNNTTNISSFTQIGSLTDWYNDSLVGSVKSEFRVYNGGSVVKSDGTLWTWGLGGVQGHGDTTARSSPTQVGSLTNWHKFETQSGSGFGLKTDNTLWGLGSQSGDGSTTNHSSPVQIGSAEWKDFGTKWAGCNAVKTNGTLWSWGDGVVGSLGDGTTVSKSSPSQIGSLTTWAKVGGGRRAGRAIKTDGTLWVWGWNNAGQLGTGDTTSLSSPVQVGTGWYKVQTGTMMTIGLKTDGTMWSWGSNSSGVLGHSVVNVGCSSPIQIGEATHWADIAVGKVEVLAITGTQR